MDLRTRSGLHSGRVPLLAAALLIALVGCSSPETEATGGTKADAATGTDTSVTGTDDADTSATDADTSATDADAEPGTDAVAEVDAVDAVDTGADADATGDTVDPFAQCVPCSDSSPCAQGACAATGKGQCCVPTCTASCAPGSTCGTLPGNPAIKACIPDHITLCRPCQKTADCEEAGFQPGAVCHGLAGGVGSYCATPCSATTQCPTGYSCGAVTEGGSGANFCVPDSQVCACDDVAKAKGLSTECSSSNELGSCKGVRTC